LPTAPLSPGITLIHGNRAEALRDLLVAWMKAHPLSPLETETVLVQSNGVAQWLKLALAADPADGGCGIAAAMDFSLPSRFVWDVYRAVLGREAVPETSPFDKTRLTWRLMRLLPEVVVDPVYVPLKRYLEDDPLRRKRFQLAERLADLFDQYQVYRADWLAAWAAGTDALPDAVGARHKPLPDDQRWQAALWRKLVEDVARGLAPDVTGARTRPRQHAGRAAVHDAFLKRARALEGKARPAALPRRVLVFGIASLPLQTLEVLARIAQWSQVIVCVHNPCRHYWADIVSGQELLRRHQSRHPRKAGQPETLGPDDLHLHAHPLLAAWGKLGRDYIAALDHYDDTAQRDAAARQLRAIDKPIDLFIDADGTSLLQQIQQDILDLRPMAEIRAEHREVDPSTDTSLRFHVAHGPQREVEILHDQLLAAFSADPALKPRDVIVMVPDIETYAPHVEAVFGLPHSDNWRFIPFSLADRTPRQFDPLVHALELLLDLPQSRVAASDVLDLLQVPALRTRFGIGEDDLPLLHRWIREAGIRWGLNGEHRGTLGLPRETGPVANTWLFGLRRMLLGYAAGQDGPAWRDIEPYGEIGGLEAAAVGPLATLLERLEDTWRALSKPATVPEWCTRLRALMETFFAAGNAGDAFTLSQLDAALDTWEETCAEAGFNDELPLSVVAGHWLASLDAGGLSQRFFGGAVTFATLMPMRAIPFRHVCLLGMNDGDYPRARNPLDFDLMSREYRPGDRSRREDDRYLFLEALLSARERLYVSWVGRSINDNTERPPSVLVGQLRDHVRSGWGLAAKKDKTGTEAGEALLKALTTEHPLQPFSPLYFPPTGQAQRGALFTYAGEWLPPNKSPATAKGAELPALERDEPLSLRALESFLKEPVREFFRQRLGVWFEINDPATDDVEPFEPDGLARWQLQDELIRAEADARARGEDGPAQRKATLAAIARRGELPPGAFGPRLADDLEEPLDGLFDEQEKALARWPAAVEDGIELRFEHTVDGQRIEVADWLGGLRRAAAGNGTQDAYGCVVLEASALVGKDNHYRGDKLIGHWVRHLALHVALGRGVTTVVISRKGRVEFGPRDPAEARQRLQEIVAAWHDGMRRPLPLAAKTAFAWLRASFAPQFDEAKAKKAARDAYEGNFVQGELEQSAYLARAFPTFEDLWSDGEFRDLADRLLRPLQNAMPARKWKPPANEAAE